MPSGKLNGLSLSSLYCEGLVQKMLTPGRLPKANLYSPLAGSTTRKGICRWAKHSSR